jgi:hypothetical protein
LSTVVGVIHSPLCRPAEAAILFGMNRPSQLSWAVFRASTAVAEGYITEVELKSKAWRELRRDVYVDSRVPLDHSVACHAVGLSLPDDICFSGPSAAYLMGVSHAADYEDAVHLTVPPGAHVKRIAGIRVRRAELPFAERDWVDGLQVTSALRTAWDVGATLPAPDAVPILDSLLGLALVTPAELLGYAESRRHDRGGRSAARAFELADGRARTPEASRLRLALLAAGLPRPVPHGAVVHSGQVRAPELTWPPQRVGLAFPHDHVRYSDADWLVLRIDPDRMDAELPTVVRELRGALLARGWQGPRS